MKFIFVTGGVLSSVGKGIVAGSLGKILKTDGVKIGVQKLDPYINVDPGTMSPYQHGEVFVTEDGAETDLDLGHYERFLNISLKKSCSVSAGQIYARVLEKERAGHFLGGTIQVIPHITQEIKEAIKLAAIETNADVLIVEVGGTIGDVEGLPFYEAIRQMQSDYGRENTLFVHVTWLPFVRSTNELKTKPSQHSLAALRSIGITPDLVIARADHPVDLALCKKIASFANLSAERVIPLETFDSPFQAPLALEQFNVSSIIMKHFSLTKSVADWSAWKTMIAQKQQINNKKISIALVGKYITLHDAYISVKEALLHAGQNNNVDIEIQWINAEEVTDETAPLLFDSCDGILVPGGFGNRAVEGKICAARWARNNNIPYLGLCLGMQVLCIELAREFIDKAAHSVECNKDTPAPIVALMDAQQNVTQKGGTMRLGVYPCTLVKGSKAAQAYEQAGQTSGIVYERHRHRFEVNNKYRKELEAAGIIISGASPDGNLVEIVELKNHPFMIASQFHPEFLSRPQNPHPLFTAFIKAII